MTAVQQTLLHWTDPLLELAGFVALFLTVGAVGLRFAVLRTLRHSTLEDERGLAIDAARRAAGFALTGAALSVVLFVRSVPLVAADHHTTAAALLTHDLNVQLQGGLRFVALTGFLLAALGAAWGWPIAALGVVVGLLRAALFAQWLRLINPMHALAGGLWIGTLFYLVVAALPVAMRASRPAARREALTARLIGAFSPLALVAAAVLALFGVITAWRHLKHLHALWSTPYGVTLLIKLGVVAGVAALGAWNWKRVKPRLGAEGGAMILKRSARAEVIVASVVLVVTAVLVSLPSP
jgi:copper transport protein